MFSPQPIGYVKSPYQNSKQIPKGLGAKHDAEGILEILPQFEAGLTHIEGFSHLVCSVGIRSRRRIRFGCYSSH